MSKVMLVKNVVVTKDSVTLYDENWKAHIFHQGSPQMVEIEKLVIPTFLKHGVANFSNKEVETPYSTFESKSKVVQFFVMSARKLKQYFTRDESGQLSAQIKRLLESDRTGLQKLKNPEIGGIETRSLEGNNSVNREGRNTQNNEDREVAVAVIDGNIIPDIDRLAVQINHSNQTKNIKGMENLLLRLSKMIHNRDHSVEDILRFLELSDLPITNDGNIVVYKAVQERGLDPTSIHLPFKLSGRRFVDHHTGKVIQWMGSQVQVSDDYVNKNRSNECAQGLHVARRSYLSSFSYDACVLCIVRPEDIMTVPNYDASKVRVTSYQIIDILTREEYRKLRNHESFIIDEDSEKKYNRAINDQYGEPTHLVTVKGSEGTNVSYEPLAPVDTPTAPKTVHEKPVHIEDTLPTLNKPKGATIKVSSFTTSPFAYVTKDMLKLLPVTSKNEAVQMAQWKACHKKSWASLGVSYADAVIIEEYLGE